MHLKQMSFTCFLVMNFFSGIARAEVITSPGGVVESDAFLTKDQEILFEFWSSSADKCKTEEDFSVLVFGSNPKYVALIYPPQSPSCVNQDGPVTAEAVQIKLRYSFEQLGLKAGERFIVVSSPCSSYHDGKDKYETCKNK